MPGIIFKQILTMFALICVGYALMKSGKITNEGSKSIGQILIYVSLPSVIINGFMVDRSSETIRGLLIASIVSIIVILISLVIAHLIFKKDEIADFATGFCNPGFFGVPIIAASLGGGAVFYIAPFIAFLNIMQWSYGVSLLTGEKDGLDIKSIMKAPFFIATCIGLLIFFSGINVPVLVQDVLSMTASVNTPLSMFMIGIYLSEVNLTDMFKNKANYLIALGRGLIIPFVAMIIIYFVPNTYMDLKMAIMIAIACPVGTNVAVYSHLHGKNYHYAVQTVILSTLLAIVTIPFVVWVFNFIV